MVEMKVDEEYWYMKGVEDFSQFLIDNMPEGEQRKGMILMVTAVSNQLRRNIKLVKELMKKDGA